MQIFVTDTHTRMALAVVRELGAAGHRVVSVTREGFPSLGHASRYAAARVTLPHKTYAADLLALGAEGGSVLLPVGMYTLNVIAGQHAEFSAVFKGLFSEKTVLDAAADKPTVAKIAAQAGLLVPEEYPPHAPKFPCVLKYRNGEAMGLRAHERYAIAENEEQYTVKLQAMKERAQRAVGTQTGNAEGGEEHGYTAAGEIFASQYISGDAFGVGAVLDENSRPLSLFCHERVREYPITGGPACCAKAVWHPKMIDAAVSLFEAAGLKGFAMAEFKGTPDAPYILEINPRIWGAYPLSLICGAGMAQAYVGGAVGGFSPPDFTRIPRWVGKKMQYLANDLAHLAARVKARRRTRGNPLWDMLCPRTRGGVFSFRDLPASFAYIKSLARKRSSNEN